MSQPSRTPRHADSPEPDGRGGMRAPLALGAATLVSAMPFLGAPPLFAEMAPDLGVGIPTLGQIMTAMLLTGAALALVVGPLADRHGIRRLMMPGAGSAVLCLFGFGIAPTFAALLVAAVLGGLANATLPSLSQAYARTALTGAAQRSGIGWATAGGAGAAIAVVPLLAIIGGIVGWRAAFIAAGLIAAALAWFLVMSLPPEPQLARPRQGSDGLLAAYAPLLRDRSTRRLHGAAVLRAICWFGQLAYFGALLHDEHRLDATWLGAAYMLGGSGYFAGSLLAGRLLRRLPPRRVIRATNLTIAMVVGLVFAVIQTPAIAIALLAIGAFSTSLGLVGMVTLLGAESPSGPGATMALNGALMNLGSAGGGALGGLLLATGGYGALGAVLPLFALATLPLLARPRDVAVVRNAASWSTLG